jgi:hypothetical protein
MGRFVRITDEPPKGWYKPEEEVEKEDDEDDDDETEEDEWLGVVE